MTNPRQLLHGLNTWAFALVLSIAATWLWVTMRAASAETPLHPALLASAVDDSIALDSCAALEQMTVPAESLGRAWIPAAVPGAWTDVERVSLGAVSLEVPRGYTARGDSLDVQLTHFPQCRRSCDIQVRVEREDGDRTLEQFVNGRIQAGYAPELVRVGAERGVVMQMECAVASCLRAMLFIKRGRNVATAEISGQDLDARPAVMCRLARMATTMRWVDTAASLRLPAGHD